VFDHSQLLALQRSQQRIREELGETHYPGVALEVIGSAPAARFAFWQRFFQPQQSRHAVASRRTRAREG
jgi:hypothetical protein